MASNSMNMSNYLPQRMTDIDSTFGTLSIDSGDCFPFPLVSLSDASFKRHQELQEAAKSMKNCALPSRYLLANGSTPQKSGYFVDKNRPSTGASNPGLANASRVSELLDEVCTILDSEEGSRLSTQSCADAAAKMREARREAEISLQNQGYSSAEIKKMAEIPIEDDKISMESSLREAEEDLLEHLLTKSALSKPSGSSQNTSMGSFLTKSEQDLLEHLLTKSIINSRALSKPSGSSQNTSKKRKSLKQRYSSAEIEEISEIPIEDVIISMESFRRKSGQDPPEHLTKSVINSRTLSKPSGSSQNTSKKRERFNAVNQRILSATESIRSRLELLESKKKTKLRSSIGTSLTTDPSEVYHFTEARRENVLPEVHPKKSIPSSGNSPALSTFPNGRLPIKTTKTELIWGCIKPGKSSFQEFIITNRSPSCLGIQCAVSNPSFRLHEEGTDLNFSSMVKVVLHPHEARTLTVVFAPTALGASVDRLNFITLIDPAHQQTTKQFVKLYGYGGYANVSLQTTMEDYTTGNFGLSLGNIDRKQELRKSFVIKNNGSLAAFTHFSFISHGLFSFLNIEISPSIVVLLPGEERKVYVTYNLHKKDHGYIRSRMKRALTDIGELQVVHGTEVDRARLRKLCQEAKERNHKVKSCVLELVAQFPNEVIPNDLGQFRESLSSMDEIFRFFNNQEISLSLERDT